MSIPSCCPKQIKEYLERAITAFVAISVDTWFDAKEAGKTDEYLTMLSNTWPCIEGRTTGITEFRLENLPVDDDGPVATHDNDQALNQCIGREIAALAKKGAKADEWADVADAVKKNLVGTIRPIDVPVKTGEIEDEFGEKVTTYKFEPLLDSEGNPVVRKITEEDVDRLGEAVMSTILNG